MQLKQLYGVVEPIKLFDSSGTMPTQHVFEPFKNATSIKWERT